MATVGRLSRRILTAGFFLLLTTVAAAIVFVVLTRSVTAGLMQAQLVSGAPEAPLNRLADALVWGQASAIVALALLTACSFALAVFLRVRWVTPLDALRRSLMAAAAGALGQPVAGVERSDEIGATARAAERLRLAILGEKEEHGLLALQQLMERLSKDAGRLEADLALLSSAAAQARTSIEEASIRAAKASHTAIEAAVVVREGAERMTLKAENKIAALTAVAGRPLAADAHAANLASGFASDGEATDVLANLASDLEALERFARDRRTIASESAAALTVALIEAIDRLNGVADRISATADLSPKSEAA
jgi:methyl-accepting chemotaxis protein